MSEKTSFLEITRVISELENIDGIINLNVRGYSCWVEIKNCLYKKEAQHLVKGKNNALSDLLSIYGIKYFIAGISKIISILLRKRTFKTVIFTASSGLAYHNNDFIDTFSKATINNKDILFFINCNNIKELNKYSKALLAADNVIIDNYSIGIIIKALSKVYFIIQKIYIHIKPNPNIKNLSEKITRILSKPVTSLDLISCISNFRATFNLYTTLFKYINVVDSAEIVSAFSKSGICAALKEHHICVIELQHGIIGITNHGYNYSERLKTCATILPVPDIVYVYNEFWQRELQAVHFWDNNKIEIHEKFQYGIARIPLPSDIIIEHNAKFILFTGQAALYNHIYVFLTDLIATIKNCDFNIKVYYRPHPKETENDIVRLGCNQFDPAIFKVIDSSYNVTTDQLIYNCLAHVSLFSACHFDAIHFKGITFCLGADVASAIDYYIDNCKSSNFIKINNAHDLLKHLPIS